MGSEEEQTLAAIALGLARTSACPACAEIGTLSAAYRIMATPLGTFSLAGVKLRIMTSRGLWVSCSTEGCDFESRADVATE